MIGFYLSYLLQVGSPTEAERKKLIWTAKATLFVGNNWAFAHRNRKKVKGLWLKEQGIVLEEQDLQLKEQKFER